MTGRRFAMIWGIPFFTGAMIVLVSPLLGQPAGLFFSAVITFPVVFIWRTLIAHWGLK